MAKENSIKKTLILERDFYTSKGNKNASYFVRGLIQNKEVQARLTPSDMGAYALLDILYDENKKPELIVESGVMTSEDGEVINYKTYECRFVDTESEGEIAIKFKPQRPSDKSVLEFLTR